MLTNTGYSTLNYRGYDPDRDTTGRQGIALAEEIIRKRGFPGDLVQFVAPATFDLGKLREAARVVFSSASKKRRGKITLKELREKVTTFQGLGVSVREDYLSLDRSGLLKHATHLQNRIIESADKYCPDVRRSFARTYSALDDL